MLLNDILLVDRHNRPSVTSKVALRVFFINDGVPVDPVSVSAVTVFSRLSNTTPSGVIDSTTNLISSSLLSSVPLMSFGGTVLDASDYVPGTTASGIYKVKTGDYVVVLDGSLDLSGNYDLYGSGLVLSNAATLVQDYIDVWTVKYSANSDYTTVINEFSLADDTFFVLTEPVIWTIANRLINKYITLDSKVHLQVTTDLTVGNKGIDSALKNVLRDSAITNPQFRIEKVNTGSTSLASRVEVSGFSDTSALVETTSDNTMMLLFDTELLKTHAATLSGELGSIKGEYILMAKFNLLDQIIKTKPFHFIIE